MTFTGTEESSRLDWIRRHPKRGLAVLTWTCQRIVSRGQLLRCVLRSRFSLWIPQALRCPATVDTEHGSVPSSVVLFGCFSLVGANPNGFPLSMFLNKYGADLNVLAPSSWTNLVTQLKPWYDKRGSMLTILLSYVFLITGAIASYQAVYGYLLGNLSWPLHLAAGGLSFVVLGTWLYSAGRLKLNQIRF